MTLKSNTWGELIAALLMVTFAFPPDIRCQNSSNEDQRGPLPGPVNFKHPPADRKEALDQLAQMIAGDYESWAGGKQYPLTIREVGWLQRDPRLTDAQAAFMGALALTIEGVSGKVRAISYNKLVELADNKKVQVKRYRGDGQTVALSYFVDEYMTEYKNLTTNVNAKGFDLWGRSGKPTIIGLQQFQLGDCFWMAAIGAVVLKQPQSIQSMIQQTAWDKYVVKFPGREEPIRVTLTQGEISQFSIGNNDGCWMPILGLAEARVLDKSLKKQKAFWKITPMGSVNHGASTSGALHILTGHKYTHVSLNNVSQRRVAKLLREATERNIPVCFTTERHGISVADYDPNTQMIRLHNPWGYSGEYKVWNNNACVAKVTMVNGFFSVPLSQACEIFSTIDVPAEMAESES